MTCAALPPDLALRTLPRNQPLPKGLTELLAQGLGEGHSFLRLVETQWADPDGPYADPAAALFVVSDGKGPVALASLVADGYTSVPRTGRLKHVYVSPACRGQGLAEALVRAVLARARGHYERLRLRTANPSAARLYERHGFEPRDDEPESTHLLVLGR